MANITYEIKSTIAVLGHGTKGWQRELNLISWNNAEPKFDIRDWDPEHKKMGKGITLDFEEATAVVNALKDYVPVATSASQPEPVVAQPEPTPQPQQAEPQPEPATVSDPVNGFSAAQLAAIEKARAMMANA